MSKETEKDLVNWEASERDYCDVLHWHFEDFGRWEWLDVREEGLRVLNLMLNCDAENYSVLDGILAAVAAQAAAGAYASIGAALGVAGEDVCHAAADWYEQQDSPPPPVSCKEFMQKIKEATEFHAKLKKPHNSGGGQ